MTTDAQLVWFTRSLWLNRNNERRGLERSPKDFFYVFLTKGTRHSSCHQLLLDIRFDSGEIVVNGCVVRKDVCQREFGHWTKWETLSEIHYEIRVVVRQVVFVKKESESIGIVRTDNFVKKIEVRVDGIVE
jgi:hypothetical protein